MNKKNTHKKKSNNQNKTPNQKNPKTDYFTVNIPSEKDLLAFSERRLLITTSSNFYVKSKGRWQYRDRNFKYMYV